MSIMDKFSAVEIKADERISKRDRDFCQQHQEAFDRSGPALQKVSDILEAEEKEQKRLLAPEDSFYHSYMGHTQYNPYEIMVERNEHLIHAIVQYFQDTYRVGLDEEEIKKHLIPEKPTESSFLLRNYRKMSEAEKETLQTQQKEYKENLEKYTQTLRHLPLRYEQIVDEIFLQLGGFSFQKQAMKALLEKCWEASHYRCWQDEEKFAIKSSTLSLTGYWCSCRDDWRSQHSWEPSDNLKTILNAAAHYETGLMECGYRLFPQLFQYDTEQNLFELTDTKKVKSVKLFKNGRVNIKFANAATVQEFVDNYLRQNMGGV